MSEGMRARLRRLIVVGGTEILRVFASVSDRLDVGFSLLCSHKIIHPNGPWYMPPEPVPPDPGRDEAPRPVPTWPDWMDDPAYLALRAGDEDPGDLGLDEDPDAAPPPDVDEQELAAEAERITAEQAREAALLAGAGLTAAVAADAAAAAGRRGPGAAGAADSFPGGYASRASG